MWIRKQHGTLSRAGSNSVCVGSVAGQLRLSCCLLTFSSHLVRDRPSKTLLHVLSSLMACGYCTIPLWNIWKPFRCGFRFLKQQWNRIQTELDSPTVLLWVIFTPWKRRIFYLVVFLIFLQCKSNDETSSIKPLDWTSVVKGKTCWRFRWLSEK